MGKTEVFLFELGELGGEDDAAGVTGPMLGIEAGIVLGKVGVTTVAEDGFYEVEVGDEVPGGKEPDFHALFFGETGDFRAHDGAEKEGDEDLGGRRARAGEGEDHEILGWIKRGFEKTGEGLQRDFFFIGRDGQSALGDVEDSFGGAAVGGRVVADSLMDPVGTQNGRLEVVLIRWKGEHATNAVAFEDEGSGGDESGGVVVEDFREVVVDGLIDRAKVVGEQAGFFLKGGDQGAAEVEKGVVGFVTDDLVAPGGEFQVHEFP